MRSTFFATLLAIVCGASAASAADYSAKGTVATTTTNLASGVGGASGGKLVVPNAAGTYPLIVASHGFSASADNQVGWAEHFASYGFVVVAPTFPNSFSPDHAKNGGIVKALATTLATLDTPAKGKIDTTKLGLEGHSAGGLATTLAAADLTPEAVVLFDPVDNANAGKTAYAKLCGPVIDVFAQPSSCNNNTGWFDFRTTAKGPTTSFRVKASTHCDGENAPRSLCGLTCGGGADTTRQKAYAKYATAFFLAHLKGDTAANAELTASALGADTALSDVSVGGGAPCTGGDTDAGTPPADGGGSTDSGTPATDSGTPSTDGGSSGTDSGSTGTDSGSGATPTDETTADSSGCSCTMPSSSSSASGALAALLTLAALSRRRR